VDQAAFSGARYWRLNGAYVNISNKIHGQKKSICNRDRQDVLNAGYEFFEPFVAKLVARVWNIL